MTFFMDFLSALKIVGITFAKFLIDGFFKVLGYMRELFEGKWEY